MANIKEALKITLAHEGGYVFDVDDPGGETYKGVARNANPKWSGWEYIDSLKKKSNFPKNLDSNIQLQDSIISLYKSNYWDVIKGDSINNQLIANKIFDIAINMGAKTASRLVQITLGVTVDGNIGNESITALNGVNFDLFMSQFRLVIISRYMAICKNRYKSRKFLYGWIKRALS